MKYLQVKHDTIEGKNRWSVGPYSHKEAVNKWKQLMERHRKWHARPDHLPIVCIITIQETQEV